MEREAQVLQRLNEETMKARKIQELEENIQRAILEAKTLNEDQDTLETNIEPTIQRDLVKSKIHMPTNTGVNLSTPASMKMVSSP